MFCPSMGQRQTKRRKSQLVRRRGFYVNEWVHNKGTDWHRRKKFNRKSLLIFTSVTDAKISSSQKVLSLSTSTIVPKIKVHPPLQDPSAPLILTCHLVFSNSPETKIKIVLPSVLPARWYQYMVIAKGICCWSTINVMERFLKRK